ncbi:creatininase family protein [Beijerinckia indica]|uniref:Creatininase n=1 Tax=Beijerinckia indica subsp. indica (strain ATCC 9039 / DSM 1715 / NCIMB 8712) TaxID=395963 RepID=B2IIN3_BEII9|nr:creatininase family protein [Beijerinckia indica]ACB94726.1 Creatininase [Beijerinckia indica subsp. indica ATCC 9039]
MLPTHFWAEMTWTDFQTNPMQDVIAVLPVAATEQHGPHLPLGVDTFLMEETIARITNRLPDDLPVLFLPVQNCGLSVEHLDFPGTLSISPDILLRAWGELGACIHRAGCRKLVLANSHGGNVGLLDMLAHELRAKLGLFVVMATLHRFGTPDGLFSEEEKRHGIHAGDIETSQMLALRPDLVRREALADFSSASESLERDFTWLRTGRPTGFGWMSQDLSASGAMGNAAAASAEKGEPCLDYAATAFIELLQDIAAFDLSRLGDPPDVDSLP